MREKFDRNVQHVNIGEIGKKENETREEKIKRIKRTLMLLQIAPVDVELKNGITSILVEDLKELGVDEHFENEKSIHHR